MAAGEKEVASAAGGYPTGNGENFLCTAVIMPRQSLIINENHLIFVYLLGEYYNRPQR
jgi:hypothetical protein